MYVCMRKDNSNSFLPSTSTEDLSEAEDSYLETEDVCTDNRLSGLDEEENNKATETDFTKHELPSSKIKIIF